MTATVAVLVVGLLGGGSGLGFLFGWTWGSLRGPRVDRREHYRAQHTLMTGRPPRRRARFRRGTSKPH